MSFTTDDYVKLVETGDLGRERIEALIRRSVMKCSACRYWDQHDDLPAGRCEKILDYDDGSPSPRSVEVRTTEGGGYLWTAADFGCTEWKPRK